MGIVRVPFTAVNGHGLLQADDHRSSCESPAAQNNNEGYCYTNPLRFEQKRLDGDLWISNVEIQRRFMIVLRREDGYLLEARLGQVVECFAANEPLEGVVGNGVLEEEGVVGVVGPEGGGGRGGDEMEVGVGDTGGRNGAKVLAGRGGVADDVGTAAEV